MFGFFFTKGPVTCFEDAKQADTAKFGRFHRGMLEHGIYLAPSAYEVILAPSLATPVLTYMQGKHHLKTRGLDVGKIRELVFVQFVAVSRFKRVCVAIVAQGRACPSEAMPASTRLQVQYVRWGKPLVILE